MVIAGLFECAWAIGIKYTDGFSKLLPSALTLAAMGVSLWLLSVAMKSIPMGTAYVVWTGIGAIGIAIIGMIFFDESHALPRILFLLLIVSGIVGLRLVSSRV
jgi:quaternary ammonium compound-resistance protein SugE